MANGSEPVWLQAITSVGSDAVSELERENAHFEVGWKRKLLSYLSELLLTDFTVKPIVEMA